MKIFVLSLLFILSGCKAIAPASVTDETRIYSDTMEIIRSAAESASDGVEGEYVLQIKASGNHGPFIYLNTELDYRDQRSVTVAIHPSLLPLFMDKYGVTPQAYFVNKSIIVRGQAQRIRINFQSQGKPSGKYYYQTHIRIMDISQIEVLEDQNHLAVI